MSGELTFQTRTFRLHDGVGASISGTDAGPPASFFLSFLCTFSHIKTFLRFPFKYDNSYFFLQKIMCFGNSEGLMVHSCWCLSDFVTHGNEVHRKSPFSACKTCKLHTSTVFGSTDRSRTRLYCIFLCNSNGEESWSQSAKYKYSVAEVDG